MDGSLVALGSSIVALNVLDLKMTWKGVHKLGAKEMNPMLKAFMELGYKPTLAFKLTFSICIATMFILRHNLLYLIIANCVFGWLCLWNLFVMRRRMRKLQAEEK